MPNSPFETDFAETIYRDKKYAHDGEQWSDTARRVTQHVMSALSDAPKGYRVLHSSSDVMDRVYELINRRQFMPGGRYLYASGRPYHQTQNCLLLKAEDSREGWANLSYKSEMALMTGAGIGVWYGDIREAGAPIAKTGGIASGPMAKMIMVNEIGRNVMQGGSRRSAIWAGLPWWHPDIDAFMRCKDWPEWLRQAKEASADGHNIPAPMDKTNISVCLDDDFFAAYHDPTHPDHERATRVYRKTIDKMITTGEPGFSINTGDKSHEVLRNAPVAGATNVLTDAGYRTVENIVGKSVSVWTGMRWASNVVFAKTAHNAPIKRVRLTGGRQIRCEPNHEFLVEQWKGAGDRKQLDGIKRVKAGNLRVGDRLHVSLPLGSIPTKFDQDSYTLGFIYGDGSFTQAGGADLTLCSEESKQCEPAIAGYSSRTENDRRGYTRLYFGKSDRFNGLSKSTFPTNIYKQSDDEVRSFLAGLFDADGNWEPTQKRIRLSSKHKEFLVGVRRALEQVGILSNVSKAGNSTYGGRQMYQLTVAAEYAQDFTEEIPTKRIKPSPHIAYRSSAIKVLSVEDDGNEDVYCADVGVPEHSFMAEGVIISNCTEITSGDDSDVCNLGSVVLPRFNDPQQFGAAVRDAVLFLTAGTFYSDVPYPHVEVIREKNRRLGLGILGVHEFMMRQGVRYGTNEGFEVLEPYMQEYARALEYACDWQDRLGCSRSVGATAEAPNGTIGIVAETTPSDDPLFAAAKRRAVINAGPHGDERIEHIVVDPVAARLLRDGVSPELIEDSYDISQEPERFFRQQQFFQKYTDHAVSTTVNLQAPITEPQIQTDFGDTLIHYLPDLRGLTCYPDGARGHQPQSHVDLQWALSQQDQILETEEATCSGSICSV